MKFNSDLWDFLQFVLKIFWLSYQGFSVLYYLYKGTYPKNVSRFGLRPVYLLNFGKIVSQTKEIPDPIFFYFKNSVKYSTKSS